MTPRNAWELWRQSVGDQSALLPGQIPSNSTVPQNFSFITSLEEEESGSRMTREVVGVGKAKPVELGILWNRPDHTRASCHRPCHSLQGDSVEGARMDVEMIDRWTHENWQQQEDSSMHPTAGCLVSLSNCARTATRSSQPQTSEKDANGAGSATTTGKQTTVLKGHAAQ